MGSKVYWYGLTNRLPHWCSFAGFTGPLSVANRGPDRSPSIAPRYPQVRTKYLHIFQNRGECYRRQIAPLTLFHIWCLTLPQTLTGTRCVHTLKKRRVPCVESTRTRSDCSTPQARPTAQPQLS